MNNSIDGFHGRCVWLNRLGAERSAILKVEHSHRLPLGKSISWNKNPVKPRDMNNGIYSSAAHNCTDLETTQNAADRTVDK